LVDSEHRVGINYMIPMAGDRHKDRRRLNAWIFERDFDVLKKVAEREGISVTALIEKLIEELRETHGPTNFYDEDNFDNDITRPN